MKYPQIELKCVTCRSFVLGTVSQESRCRYQHRKVAADDLGCSEWWASRDALRTAFSNYCKETPATDPHRGFTDKPQVASNEPAGSDKKPEGWSWLINSRKDHYFVSGRSLCGRWMRLSNSDLSDSSSNKCERCAQLAERRKQKGAV